MNKAEMEQIMWNKYDEEFYDILDKELEKGGLLTVETISRGLIDIIIRLNKKYNK